MSKHERFLFSIVGAVPVLLTIGFVAIFVKEPLIIELQSKAGTVYSVVLTPGIVLTILLGLLSLAALISYVLLNEKYQAYLKLDAIRLTVHKAVANDTINRGVAEHIIGIIVSTEDAQYILDKSNKTEAGES